MLRRYKAAIIIWMMWYKPVIIKVDYRPMLTGRHPVGEGKV